MGAVTTALIAIAGVILGWITIEIACKPCLDKGREAMDRNLNPDYDPDDDLPSATIRAPLNPNTTDPESVTAPATISAPLNPNTTDPDSVTAPATSPVKSV